MFEFIASWFGSELWLALLGIAIAAGWDVALTVALSLIKRPAGGFSWGRLPQFLLTNVLPCAAAVIGGAVVVKFQPDLKAEYLGAALLLSGWLAKDWRGKAKELFALVTKAVPSQDQHPAA